MNRFLPLVSFVVIQLSTVLWAQAPPPQEPMPEVLVALTFDDGPHGLAPEDEQNQTSMIRKILSENGASGTFFVETSRIKGKTGAANLKAMKDGGHEVAIHGVHPEKHHLSYALTEEFADKLKKIKKLIKDAIGIEPKLIRPPGGEATLAKDLARGFVDSAAINGVGEKKEVEVPKSVNDAGITQAEKDEGLTDYLGDGTSGAESWSAQVQVNFDDAEKAVLKKMDEAKSTGKLQRAIILMHDVGSTSVVVRAGLADYIKKLKKAAEDKKVRLHFLKMSDVIVPR